MKFWILSFLLIFLVACSVRPPLDESQIPSVQKAVAKVESVANQSRVSDELLPTKTVRQESSGGAVEYKLSDDNKILSIKKTGEEWIFTYEAGKISQISGPSSIEFLYVLGLLNSIDFGAIKHNIKRDVRGRIVKVDGLDYPINVDYDSNDRISAIRRGKRGTTFFYDSKDQLNRLDRGPKQTLVIYDKKGRVRNFDADDSQFIFNYWRDNKLVSLTGKTFGTGLTVSYGPPAAPPTEALFVGTADDSVFKSAYTDSLYAVVDQYLYCNYVRRLKSIPFEGISFAFYQNYFNATVQDYFVMNYVCEAFD